MQFNQLTQFTYARDLPIYRHEKPYSVLSYFKDGQISTNLAWETGSEEIVEDIRGREDQFTLDEHGFCFRVAPTNFEQWTSPSAVEERYLPEVSELLKHHFDGVDHVEIFDWRRRLKRDRENISRFTDMNDPSDPLAPARQVHLDQSPIGVVKRIQLLMGNRANYLLRGRIRLINIWRPIKEVTDWPLALCDGSSMGYHDLLEVDLVRRDYVGSTMYAKYRPGYKWYYLDKQRPDEVCFFKNFDSSELVRSQICPHVSFPLKNSQEDAPPRESIEVRALVFTFPIDEADKP